MDLYDVMRLPNGLAAFLCGNVTGSPTHAALAMTQLHSRRALIISSLSISFTLFLSEPVWGNAVLSPPSLGKLVDAETDVIASEGGDPDSGMNLIRLLKKKGRRYRFGTVPMDTSPEEVSRWVKVEQEYLGSKGRKVTVKEVEIFHVPFIWAVLDLSG